MSTKYIGDKGETEVAAYLETQGYKILERNWRTRWCEIDIVAKKGQCVYFVEVKYRSSDAWGHGLEYVTKKKQQQMRFAAELWLQSNKWKSDALLSAASVNSTGEIDFIEDINT